jgi:hypothetical protein
MSLTDVASVLQLEIVDAIMLLESRGYDRQLEQIALSDDERRSRLEAMREDRLQRQGRFDFSQEDVARDVIASERLEGVDARPWVRRTAH